LLIRQLSLRTHHRLNLTETAWLYVLRGELRCFGVIYKMGEYAVAPSRADQTMVSIKENSLFAVLTMEMM
jgi:hypothetical protein